jgi:hypothetical protein
VIQAVVRIFVQDDGTELYQPGLIRYPEGAAPSAGELLVQDSGFFDCEETASQRAAQMVEAFLGVLEKVAEGTGDA